jgi:AcrR family transcriptional regulator
MPRRATADGSGPEPPASLPPTSLPPASLRSQHVEATRRAVLAAARSSFGSQGYAQTSVDEIAAAARVTKGAVYHHFASKVALFRAVYSEVEAEAQARTAEAVDPEGSPIDQIVAGVNAYLDVALDAEVQRITLIDGPAVLGLEPEGPAEQQPGYLALRLGIATAIAHGYLRDFDPDVVAHLIGGLALLGGVQIARSSQPEVTRAALGRAVEAMLRGLAPGRGR